jgi:hypothetical protein
MSLSQQELAEILVCGGSVRINSAGLSDSDLVQLAASAKGHGLLTIVVNSALSQSVMVDIAATGDGSVTFDLAGWVL